jgi:hypothetical protein
MQFKLMIEDKEKIFYAPYIKGRIFRRALEMNKKLNAGEVDVEVSDELVTFVCEVFNNQFTPAEVWDGLELEGVLPKLQDVFFEVINKGTSSVQGGTAKNE